eukprot:TRINITY_DN3095_c0_g1_i1.p1 TRINITY_DN3095_c0_g1~~TRINITY_DN3095_c0_g1_i1.p1  ORF type:complete len:178 (-),score=84.10 TRINITY_DN3095_c0_g1_i1:26-559(-)
MTDRPSVIADVSVDRLVQQRKNSRARKDINVILDKDEWGKLNLVIQPQKGKGGKSESYKLEGNIVKIHRRFENEGKCSLELEVPHITVLLNTKHTEALKKVFDIIQVAKENPRKLAKMELFNDDEEEGYSDEADEDRGFLDDNEKVDVDHQSEEEEEEEELKVNKKRLKRRRTTEEE